MVHTATGYVTDFADYYYDDERVTNSVASIAFALPAVMGRVPGRHRGLDHVVRGGAARVLAGLRSIRPLLGPGRRSDRRTLVAASATIGLASLAMLAFRVVPLGPQPKFLLVAFIAVPVCFTVGYTLTRLPGVGPVV